MTVPVVVLTPALEPSVSNILELTLRAVSGTPTDILLYPRPVEALAGMVTITLTAMGISDSWPVYNQVSKGIEWYQDGIKYTGTAEVGSGGAVFPPVPEVKQGTVYGPNGSDYTGTYNPLAVAVFPAVGKVIAGITYGPTGANFTGTVSLPGIADVKNGVSYGAGGSEFTGTYSGGGTPLPSMLFDIASGKMIKVLSDKLGLSL